jgi:hypothetical protein
VQRGVAYRGALWPLSIIGTDNPNLFGFRNAAGKMITWHGLADRLVFPQGTVDYR